MDVWKDLEPLRRNRDIGAPAVILFGAAWELCGGQPGTLTISTKAAQKLFARDRASLLAQFKRLHQVHDLFHMRWRDRQGRYQFDVYRPAAGHAEAPLDPQMELPAFGEAIIEPQVLAEGFLFVPALSGRGLQGEGQEPQRSGMTGEPQCLAQAGAALQARRGEIPTGTADPWGNPHASSSSAVGISPRPSRGDFPTAEIGPRGEFPTNKDTEFSAGKPAVGNSPIPSREGRGEIPAPRVRTRPPASLVPTKQEYISTNGSNDSNEPNDPTLGVAGGSAAGGVGNSPRHPDDALLADLQRRLERQRAAAGGSGAEPRGASSAIAAAIGAHYSPQVQKARLIDELRGLVDDPGTHEWLFGYAADLMVVWGQSSREDAGEICGRVEAMLAELREFRQLRTKNGQPQVPRGMVFNRRVMAIARAYRIPGPKELKARREAQRRKNRCVKS